MCLQQKAGLQHAGKDNAGSADTQPPQVRALPGIDGKLVGKMPKGSACEILELTEDGWAHIKEPRAASAAAIHSCASSGELNKEAAPAYAVSSLMSTEAACHSGRNYETDTAVYILCFLPFF